MPKMVVKGVVWNPESPWHMEVLEWATKKSTNFSDYLRSLVIRDYERSQLKDKSNETKPQFKEEYIKFTDLS